MERLELSKQKLLGPKSSASTNFATFAFKLFFLVNKFLSLKIRVKNLFIYIYTIDKTCGFSL